MSQSTFPMTPQTGAPRQGPIVVELGTQPLPPRMRLGGLRRSLRVSIPNIGGARRIMMVPVAMMTRLLSR